MAHKAHKAWPLDSFFRGQRNDTQIYDLTKDSPYKENGVRGGGSLPSGHRRTETDSKSHPSAPPRQQQLDAFSSALRSQKSRSPGTREAHDDPAKGPTALGQWRKGLLTRRISSKPQPDSPAVTLDNVSVVDGIRAYPPNVISRKKRVPPPSSTSTSFRQNDVIDLTLGPDDELPAVKHAAFARPAKTWDTDSAILERKRTHGYLEQKAVDADGEGFGQTSDGKNSERKRTRIYSPHGDSLVSAVTNRSAQSPVSLVHRTPASSLNSPDTYKPNHIAVSSRETYKSAPVVIENNFPTEKRMDQPGAFQRKKARGLTSVASEEDAGSLFIPDRPPIQHLGKQNSKSLPPATDLQGFDAAEKSRMLRQAALRARGFGDETEADPKLFPNTPEDDLFGDVGNNEVEEATITENGDDALQSTLNVPTVPDLPALPLNTEGTQANDPSDLENAGRRIQSRCRQIRKEKAKARVLPGLTTSSRSAESSPLRSVDPGRGRIRKDKSKDDTGNKEDTVKERKDRDASLRAVRKALWNTFKLLVLLNGTHHVQHNDILEQYRSIRLSMDQCLKHGALSKSERSQILRNDKSMQTRALPYLRQGFQASNEEIENLAKEDLGEDIWRRMNAAERVKTAQNRHGSCKVGNAHNAQQRHAKTVFDQVVSGSERIPPDNGPEIINFETTQMRPTYGKLPLAARQEQEIKRIKQQLQNFDSVAVTERDIMSDLEEYLEEYAYPSDPSLSSDEDENEVDFQKRQQVAREEKMERIRLEKLAAVQKEPFRPSTATDSGVGKSRQISVRTARPTTSAKRLPRVDRQTHVRNDSLEPDAKTSPASSPPPEPKIRPTTARKAPTASVLYPYLSEGETSDGVISDGVTHWRKLETASSEDEHKQSTYSGAEVSEDLQSDSESSASSQGDDTVFQYSIRLNLTGSFSAFRLPRKYRKGYGYDTQDKLDVDTAQRILRLGTFAESRSVSKAFNYIVQQLHRMSKPEDRVHLDSSFGYDEEMGSQYVTSSLANGSIFEAHIERQEVTYRDAAMSLRWRRDKKANNMSGFSFVYLIKSEQRTETLNVKDVGQSDAEERKADVEQCLDDDLFGPTPPPEDSKTCTAPKISIQSNNHAMFHTLVSANEDAANMLLNAFNERHNTLGELPLREAAEQDLGEYLVHLNKHSSRFNREETQIDHNGTVTEKLRVWVERHPVWGPRP